MIINMANIVDVMFAVNKQEEGIYVIIEVIALTKDDVLEAEQCGYDRVELVSAIEEDGLTPDIDLLRSIINEKPSIRVQVMVRPHDNGFYYSKQDTQQILQDFQELHRLGINHFVFGALNEDGSINEQILQQIEAISTDIRITFHRAIDYSNDLQTSYQTLATYPNLVERVLTSGGAPDCIQGKDQILRLIQLADQLDGPVIMPGSGLQLSNLLSFHDTVQAKEYHIGKGVRREKSYDHPFVQRPMEWK
ncbi:copper homeostasis protein CutC [Gracilibacillus phocaeensis]|nr:copper homeostasis protein CutC [Gracilibacillus phocaeensis]